MVIGQALRQPALLDQTRDLTQEMFSSELLGRVYGQMCQRHREHLEVNVNGLTDFSSEEMSHIAGILHSQQGPVNEQALLDCVATIRKEYQSRRVTTDEDILAQMERMKKSKGYKA